MVFAWNLDASHPPAATTGAWLRGAMIITRTEMYTKNGPPPPELVSVERCSQPDRSPIHVATSERPFGRSSEFREEPKILTANGRVTANSSEIVACGGSAQQKVGGAERVNSPSCRFWNRRILECSCRDRLSRARRAVLKWRFSTLASLTR